MQSSMFESNLLEKTDMTEKQKINYLISILSDWKNVPKNEKIIEHLNNLINVLAKEISKDHNLICLLEDLDGITKKDYHNTQIPNDYIIIYFPTADMIKFYKPGEIDKFIYQARAHFKDKEYWEVVRNNSEQKIIIVYDSSNKQEIDKLIKYIIKYSNMTFNSGIKSEDVITITDKKSNTSEIILNKYISNIKEKELFCEKLMEYIKSCENNTRMTRKFNMDQQGNFENAQCYNTINKMVSLSSNKRETLINEIKNAIMTSTRNCERMNVYFTFNINYNDCNIQNIQDSVIHNNTTPPESDNPFDMFIYKIKFEKPSWYKVNQWQHQCELYEKFNENYDPISQRKFTNEMRNRIFSEKKSKWINGVNKMAFKLFNWNQIN